MQGLPLEQSGRQALDLLDSVGVRQGKPGERSGQAEQGGGGFAEYSVTDLAGGGDAFDGRLGQ